MHGTYLSPTSCHCRRFPTKADAELRSREVLTTPSGLISFASRQAKAQNIISTLIRAWKNMTDKPSILPPELFPLEKDCFHPDFQKYFKAKRQNFFLNLTTFRSLWDCLQVLNDILTREHDNLEHLIDERHLLPKTIFAAAHARFLTAIELAFSCCIGDAYSVLRDGIESVAHAHKIFKEPAAAEAWTNKHKGDAELEAHDKMFTWHKKKNLFPDDVPGFRQLHFYYGQFCEMATHNSVTSIGRSFRDLSTPGMVRWGFAYFEINPQRLAGLLLALLQVSAHMEEVFYGCFEPRLTLDPDLGRMRAEFQQLRQQQTHYLKGIADGPKP
jgi:hypothetical protein